MADSPKPPQVPLTSQDPMADVARTLNMLVARIYDSQKKLGLWGMSPEEDPTGEDLAGFFANMHLRVSTAYESWLHGELSEQVSDPEGGYGHLIDMAQACLGLCRRLGVDVGKLFMAVVVAQARSAAEQEKQSIESMLPVGEFSDGGDGGDGEDDGGGVEERP